MHFQTISNMSCLLTLMRFFISKGPPLLGRCMIWSSEGEGWDFCWGRETVQMKSVTQRWSVTLIYWDNYLWWKCLLMALTAGRLSWDFHCPAELCRDGRQERHRLRHSIRTLVKTVMWRVFVCLFFKLSPGWCSTESCVWEFSRRATFWSSSPRQTDWRLLLW